MGTKISAMDAATALVGTETLAVVQGGETVAATVQAVRGCLFGIVLDTGALYEAVPGISSCSKTATGTYQIVLATTYEAGDAVPIVTPSASGDYRAAAVVTSTTVITVTVRDSAGAAADNGFHFAIHIRS